MMDKSPWQQFFDEHAPVYDENIFTRNTLAEVDFLVAELALPPGAAILDVACGTGRHSVALAQRGYAVTGLDLSAGMLERAAAAARAAGVSVEFIQADATRFTLPAKYDAALCLCEGAFGLLGLADDPADQPLAILRNISRSLKPGGHCVFTVLNATAMLRHQTGDDIFAGRCDPVTLTTTAAFPPREGLPPVTVRERYFVSTELALLFRLAGLAVDHLGGGTAGQWARRPLDLDEMEIMVIARKAGEPVAMD